MFRRSRSQVDGMQLVKCPDKQTRGHQDEKRDRDLGDHQKERPTAAWKCATAAILERGHDVRTRRLKRWSQAK